LDFFSVIGNRISNTSYHFQYLYYPGGNETGAKPNLITCITEIFLSAEVADFVSVGPHWQITWFFSEQVTYRGLKNVQ
jgi:hypothetical protein